MSTNSVQLHRVIAAPPEKIFRAFTDADAIASWLPPYGFVAKVYEMNVNTGGSYRMSFTNFSTGNGHSFGGEYLEIVPGQIIKYTDRFDDPNLTGDMITTVSLKDYSVEIKDGGLRSDMITTVSLKAVSCGTELNITQEGIPSMIPVEMCYLGWQDSLEKLKKLVEPNIPDA